MPVQSAYTPDAYSGDGVTNAFTVTFLFQLPTDLVVQTQLLSTNAAENRFLEGPGVLDSLSREWDLGPLSNPAVLCVTDALGCSRSR